MQRDVFLNEIEDVRNVLLGNGFSLSHPKFGNHFGWNKETAIVKNIDNIFKFESKGNCESDLSIIRKNILKLILKHYLENLMESDETRNLKQVYNKFKDFTFNPYHCTQFLSNRENIFTLNYDPILYFEGLYLKEFNKVDIIDGFVTKSDNGKDGCLKKIYDGISPTSPYLRQPYIVCKLKNQPTGTKIYYLHGSWFIISNKDDELKKLSFGQDSEDTMDSIFENDCRPDLILEDRSLVKKALIENTSIYHKFCFEQLSNIKGNLLIFGCSFEHDRHILEKISQNKNLNLTITFIDDNEGDSIKEKCQKLQNNCRFIKVDKHVIWENGNDPVGKYTF